MDSSATLIGRALVALKMTKKRCSICRKNRLAVNNKSGVCRGCQRKGKLRKNTEEKC